MQQKQSTIFSLQMAQATVRFSTFCAIGYSHCPKRGKCENVWRTYEWDLWLLALKLVCILGFGLTRLSFEHTTSGSRRCLCPTCYYHYLHALENYQV
ncbi:unnamed protein product [Ixodes pacificus]